MHVREVETREQFPRRDGTNTHPGRDGGLTKIDMLEARIVKRVMQSGNAIGGSISQHGRIVVAQNYTPGGIKAFDAATLELLSEVPAEYAPGKFSKVVGLADSSGNKFAYALFDGGEIWVSDFSNPRQPATQRFPAGSQPYDGLVTPDGRYFLAGLFGEDGLALALLLDLRKHAVVHGDVRLDQFLYKHSSNNEPGRIALADYVPYLDERATFLGQWGLKPTRGDGPSYEELVESEGRPRLRHWLDRIQTEGMITPGVVYGYFPCYSEGDDLVILWHEGEKKGAGFEHR